MKGFFLRLLILTFASTPLVGAQESKAQTIAWDWVTAKCVEQRGLLTADVGEDFYLSLIRNGVHHGLYTVQDVERITSEESFLDLTETSTLALGGCQAIADMAKPAVIKFLKATGRHYRN